MYVRHLTLADFRSYPSAELALDPGVTTLCGRNGQGKTNLVEAIGYLATLGSHRVASDQPLVRFGTTRAVVRGLVVRGERETLVELEITPGRANRARLGRSPVSRPRDVLGTLRTVLFAPEDLALVKGEPAERRRFLDELLVQRQPRWAAVRSDYDKVVRQRGALLKQAVPLLRSGRGRRGERHTPRADPEGEQQARASVLQTLHVWDAHLATVGAQLLYARLRLLRDLGPDLAECYDAVSESRANVRATYRSSLHEEAAGPIASGAVPEVEQLRAALLESLTRVRDQEVERGVCLVGPHRDDLVLTLGDLPAKGYASHGESWSLALGLRLAAYRLLRRDLGEDPVLVLDDVFAELDTGRRARLAELVADCEQVIVTAAVVADVPDRFRRQGATFEVELGHVAPTGPNGPFEGERAGLPDGLLPTGPFAKDRVEVASGPVRPDRLGDPAPAVSDPP
ncbi:DNA replication/repair protein RecF [Intrasporangium sp.]|uniref:DNA replication/repair protein RecF n=1 Tax=Intrasporangium sp. TaxID=1925024 RepID=UPI003221F411